MQGILESDNEHPHYVTQILGKTLNVVPVSIKQWMLQTR